MSNFEYMSQLDYDRWEEEGGWNEPLTRKEILIGILKAAIAAPILWGLVWLLCAYGNTFYMQ